MNVRRDNEVPELQRQTAVEAEKRGTMVTARAAHRVRAFLREVERGPRGQVERTRAESEHRRIPPETLELAAPISDVERPDESLREPVELEPVDVDTRVQ